MIHSSTLPEVRAERVKLRWLTEADVPSLFAIFSDPEVMRYWSSEPMTDPGEAKALLDDVHAHFEARTLFQWGVALAGDDRVVGTCTLSRLDGQNRRGEIGYALAREQWGKGLMGEALTALLDYAFTELALHRIEADVDPGNAASLRLLERLGFTCEGMLRERWLVGGRAHDSVMLGLLGREWRGGRPTK